MKKHSLLYYYAGLWSVILMWSILPVLNPYFYKYISPSITTLIATIAATIALIPLVKNHLSEINRHFLKVSIITGIFNASATLIQKIGLLYTTPSRYAFLENLSCVVVPILMYFFIRKKPTLLKITSAVLCLAGCFILSGNILDGSGFGIGELLCALSGILYGVNIAATAAYATRFHAPLYVMAHMIVTVAVSIISAVVFNFITFNGEPISPAYFEWNVPIILLIAVTGVLSNTVCWTMRTSVMKHIDATAVAVMMPFSAVFTGILSVVSGQDTISFSLIAGGILVLIASIISGLSDR